MSSLKSLVFSIWSYRVVRSVISLIFVLSGASKITDLSSFAAIIDAYGLVPMGWAIAVALVLTITELIAGLGLLFDIRGSLSAITAMLLFFMLILGYGIRMGFDVDCGCFGAQDVEAAAFHGLRSALYRDFVILAGAVYLYWWRHAMNSSSVKLSGIASFLKNRRHR